MWKWLKWAIGNGTMGTVTEAELSLTVNELGDPEQELRLWFDDGHTITYRLAPGLTETKNWRV